MKIKYAANFRITALRLVVLVIFTFFSTIGRGQIAETIPYKTNAAISAVISPKVTQKFSLKHYVFSAAYFKGNAYSLYNLGGNINLGDLSLDQNLLLTQSGHTDITDGGSYTSGSLVAMGDTLYTFWRNNESNNVWYKPVTLVNGVPTTGTAVQVKFDRYFGIIKKTYSEFYTYIAATVYKRNIYMLVESNESGDNSLYLIKGTLNSSSTELTWSFVDYVRESTGTAIDITSGAVNDSYDIATMHTSAGNDSLVVGRSNNSKITLYLFRGQGKWKTYEKTTPANVSKCFKMVQGAIDGLNVDNVNTLQCIGKNVDHVYTEAFDIDSRTFVKEAELTNHDGGFAPCINLLANTDYMYNQYIHLIYGDLSSDLDVDTYASNKIMRESVTMSDPDKFLNNSSLRQLATLVGVIEGPPPSILQTQADYDASNAKYGNASPATLAKSTTATQESSTTTTITGGAEVGVEAGPVSVTLKYTREKEETNKKSQATTQSILMKSNEIAHRDSATLFYNIPSLSFNSYYLCSPNSTSQTYVKVVANPIMTDLTVGNMTTVTKHVSLTAAPFNVSNPRLLTSWFQRPRFVNKIFNNTWFQGKSAPFNFTDSKIENSFSNTTVKSTNTSNEVEMEVEVKFPEIFGLGFSAKASAKFKMAKSNSTTVQDGLGLTYQTYLQTDIPGNQYKAFNTEFGLLTDDPSSNTISGYYYTELKNAGLRRDAEKPWIITYNITSYTKYITTEIGQMSDDNELLNIKLHKQSESSVSINVLSPVNDLLTVELYSLSGQKIQTLFDKQPIASGATTLTTDCNVPTGVYVVKSRTSNGSKSSLVRL
jgi:hypothetical protein